MIITDPLSSDLHGNQRGFRKTSINQQVYEALLIVTDQLNGIREVLESKIGDLCENGEVLQVIVGPTGNLVKSVRLAIETSYNIIDQKFLSSDLC